MEKIMTQDTRHMTQDTRHPPKSGIVAGKVQDRGGRVKKEKSEKSFFKSYSLFSSLHLTSRIMCLVSCVLLSGCGYTTKSTLPQSIKTIRVEPFKNSIDYTMGTGRNIYFPLLEVKSRNAVIDRFLFDGNLKVVELREADLILKGELKMYQRTALRYTDDDDVQEYRVHVTVSFELQNARSGELSWSEPNFVGEATYFVTGSSAKSEESAVEDAILDLARRIVERTIEDW